MRLHGSVDLLRLDPSLGFPSLLPQPDLGWVCLNEDILTHLRSAGGPRASHKPAVLASVTWLLGAVMCVQLHLCSNEHHWPDLGACDLTPRLQGLGSTSMLPGTLKEMEGCH